MTSYDIEYGHAAYLNRTDTHIPEDSVKNLLFTYRNGDPGVDKLLEDIDGIDELAVSEVVVEETEENTIKFTVYVSDLNTEDIENSEMVVLHEEDIRYKNYIVSITN